MTKTAISIALLLSAQLAPAQTQDRIKAFCVDFNWSDTGFAPPGMYANASAKEHFEWYRALGANTIQTFCVSCPGYAWYRSDIAPVQPGMQGDFLKELASLGHAAKMRVMGYFCIGANTHWSEKHPDQCHPLPNSIAIPFTNEYLDYLERVIPEALERTGIDGFMIDWMYNASHHYSGKKYSWLDCEKQMYAELLNAPFPGEDAMDAEKINEFNRRAVARCWNRIHASAKKAKPDCIIWLSAYDLQHPQYAGSNMLKEADWIMNEHTDPSKLAAIRGSIGPNTRLIQCVCGWGSAHDAAKLTSDPQFIDIGWYGFARPDSTTTLPLESPVKDDVLAGNAKNIAFLRKLFNAK